MLSTSKAPSMTLAELQEQLTGLAIEGLRMFIMYESSRAESIKWMVFLPNYPSGTWTGVTIEEAIMNMLADFGYKRSS